MSCFRHVASACLFVGLLLTPWTAGSIEAQDVQRTLDSKDLAMEDPIAVVWEDEGQIVCGHTPEEILWDAFIFDDGARWSATATDGFGLQRGDPTRLTWGIVPDGTSINGFFGEPSGPSNLIAFLDSLFGSGPGGADLTQRPWFDTFEAVFTAWGELTGIRYVYQAADDGAALATASGSAARPDVRIGGHFIDGQSGSNVLAYNFFPDNGDMVIDTSNSNLFGSSFENFRPLRNTLSHEHGHGLGFNHVCPIGEGRLMEPFIDLNFDGPQEDDILMANRGYGDTLEFPGENDTVGTAENLGGMSGGDVANVSGVSIDGLTDVDFYAFSVPAGLAASVTLTPTGTSYLSGPQNPNGSCSAGSTFNALRQNDLRLELRGTSGTNLLGVADANGLGGSETLTEIPLSDGGGTYYVRVSGADDKAQMYQLSLSVVGEPDADVDVVKTQSFDPAIVGTSQVYAVTVTNAGPGVATGVEVTETLPADVTFASTTGCAEDPNGVPVCTLGSIGAGRSKSYQVTVTVDSGAMGSLLNEVEVSTTSFDPTSGDQQDSVTSSIDTATCFVADLSLDSSDTSSADVFWTEGVLTAASGFQVTSTDDVRFIAGETIALGNGFSVASGGRLVAGIDPLASCNP